MLKKFIKRRFFRYHALNGLDKKMERYLPHEGGYFVELGANDGLTQSNTYYFEKFKGWRGVLVEPVPSLFQECFQNRPGSKVFCSACVAADYNKDFVEISYGGLMSVSSGLQSNGVNFADHLSRSKAYLKKGDVPYTFGAKARTLTAILDEASAPMTIDFLSLDVEGVELEVLRGLDLKKYKVTNLLIETHRPEPVADYLLGFGYSLAESLSHHDYLYVHGQPQDS